MLYNYGKEILRKYENEENGAIKKDILYYLFWSYLKNSDVLPSKVDIPIDLKKYIYELQKYRNIYGENKKWVPIWEYPAQMIQNVIYDLELENTSLYVVGHKGLNYTFEVGFSQATIESLKKDNN